MKIVPKDGPHVMPLGRSKSDARSRAIAALSSPAAPSAPQMPTHVPSQTSPIAQAGDLTGLVTPPTQISQDSGQKFINETPSVEAPQVQTKAPEPEEPISSQYAILARKEKALRARMQAQEQAYKAKEEALRAQEAAFKAKEAEYSSKYIPKDRLSSDPLSVLTEQGLSYEKLTEMLLNPQQSQENLELKAYQKKVDEELSRIRKAQEESVKSQQDQQTQAYQQALNQIHRDVKSLVFTDPSFEMIKDTGSTRDVVDLIERTFKKEGYILPVDEACKAVEDYLMDESDKIFKIKKVREKFNKKLETPTVPSEPQKPTEQSKQPQGMKTLTNSVATSRKLSARDRAILRMQGKLE